MFHVEPLADDTLQAEIDLAYQNMIAARTASGEQYWCDRLTYFARVKRAQQERAA